VLGNNGNIYVSIGGGGTTLYGTTPAGDYIDNTIFLDWLASTIQTNLITIETDPLNLKVPYTNAGIGMIESGISAAFKQGQTNGGLAPGWSIFGPDISQVSPADKTSRTLNGVGGNGTLAGAINKINVQVFAST